MLTIGGIQGEPDLNVVPARYQPCRAGLVSDRDLFHVWQEARKSALAILKTMDIAHVMGPSRSGFPDGPMDRLERCPCERRQGACLSAGRPFPADSPSC